MSTEFKTDMQIKRKESSSGEVKPEFVEKNTHLQHYNGLADEFTVFTDKSPHPPHTYTHTHTTNEQLQTLTSP